MADVKNLLHKIARKQGFKNYKLQITPIPRRVASTSTLNYQARVEDKQNVVNLFIIKDDIITLEHISVKKKMLCEGEIFFYTDVCDIFKEIEEKHKVPEEDRYILPKYYGASMEISREMLVLEDLSVKGFTTYDRFKSIDWPYASAAVKELAKLHALSMAFEKEYPQLYTKFIDKYGFEGYNSVTFQLWFIPHFFICERVVKEENREKLKKFLNSITSAEISKIFQPGKNKVLIHARYRPSNLMHRSREDGTIQVIPIHYQTFQESCPLIDLLYFIFAGSDEEYRRQHFHLLMEHYYTELSVAMTRLGIDNSRYSRDDFDQDLKEKLKYGLVVAAEVLPLIVDLKENVYLLDQFKTNNHFLERLNGVVDDFVRWGIL